MSAIQKIEAALAAGPTETEWRPLVTRIDDARGYQICHFDLHGKSEKERDANRALVLACQPAAIREVLQTLASKEAELAEVGLKYVSLFGELQGAMGQMSRMNAALELVSNQVPHDFDPENDEAILIALSKAEVLFIRRALITTPQPTE